MHTRARVQLLAALDGFTFLGAAPWVVRTINELAATGSRGGRADIASKLTPREMEAAALAATGLTNTQIAARLGAVVEDLQIRIDTILAMGASGTEP